MFVLLLVVGKGALSQERIDTLYYSRSGMTVRNPVFADYYRLALYPADAAGLKMFKDFYISGHYCPVKAGKSVFEIVET